MKIRICFLIILIAVLIVSTTLVYAAPASVDHFRLAADVGWADSDFDVEAGQEVTITANGQAVTARINVYGPASVSGPDGQWHICPNYEGAPACAMENTPYGALVGKIGEDGTPFLIRSNYTFTADVSGDLYLAVNDLLPYYADNYGNYMVFFNH